MNLLLDPEKHSEREDMIVKARKEYDNNYGKMDLQKAYESLLEVLWYSQLPCFDVKGITSLKPDQMSFIKKCAWKGKDIPCPLIFKTIPTDKGMCCTFNMEKAEEIFRQSTYSEMIQGFQKSDKSKR